MKIASVAVTVVAVMFAGGAQAADIVDTAPAVDWTGLYIGLNAGYGFNGDDRVGASGIGNVGDLNVGGFYGGLQGGYNYQIDSIVLGAETDIQFSDIDDSDSKAVGASDWKSSDDINYWGTLRGRVGFAFDRALVYGTGGLAYGGMDYSVKTAGGAIKMNDNYSDIGWTAGGGVEYAFDDAWSMKLEYLYINLGSSKIRDGDFRTKATPDFHTVRFGVNYRF